MKKSFVLFLSLLVPLASKGQSPLVDQWFSNNYLINPAITGIERYTDIQIASRYQWSDIDGAPVSYFVSAHSPVGNPRPNKGFTKTPEPLVKDHYRYDNFRYQPHHGVGGILYYDKIGPFTNTAVNASYAFHLALGRKTFLSGGIAAGFIRRVLDTRGASAVILNDPTIANFRPTFSAVITPGVWLHGDRLYLGVSFSESIGPEDQLEIRTAIITAGYRFDSKAESIYLTPYTLVRLNGIASAYDLGLKIDWKRLIYVGTTYRSTKEAVVYFGASINFSMSLAYLHNIGPGGTYTSGAGGTHELQLNFRLKNKEKVPCPQRMW